MFGRTLLFSRNLVQRQIRASHSEGGVPGEVNISTSRTKKK